MIAVTGAAQTRAFFFALHKQWTGEPVCERMLLGSYSVQNMFDRIHHIAILCSDYPRSKHFYVDLLGFEIVRETYRGERNSFKLDLKLGECAIELFSFPNPPKRVTHPEACGLRHIAFGVENLQSTLNQLTSKGVAVEAIRRDKLTGKRFAFFRDPDDLPIEIYEE